MVGKIGVDNGNAYQSMFKTGNKEYCDAGSGMAM